MMQKSFDPWQARFGWIWFSEKEIFDFSQEDVDRQVKSYANQGINILIGFSCTHFRMSFHENWKEINECIERYAKACHRFGMLYVEHHSCHLVWHPLTDGEKGKMAEYFRENRSNPAHFRGFLEGASGDSQFGKYRMSDFYQVSGATGKPGRTCYSGYGMCFNNPYYREIYFRYLEDVYRRGIDGLMTDDVQYFGNDEKGRWNACTCKHCRRLFKKETGYDLPDSAHWDEFYDNYGNPVFVAWKKFKVESTTRFQRDVTAHFRSLGYHFIRPNYISSILEGNITAYPFERCADLWDYIFQENCSFNIIKQSYPMFAMEAIHRFAMARGRGVPSMSMFYPCTQSAVNFSFALAKAWGQLYTKSRPVFQNEKLDETGLRRFEKKYLKAFTAPKKKADLAFLLSASTRDYTAGGHKSADRMISWMQAAYLSGLACDMVFEWDEEKTMEGFRAIAAVSCEMLSDDTLNSLFQYIKNGGTLLVIGSFARLKDDGTDGSSRTAGILPETPGGKVFGKGRIVRLAENDCIDSHMREVFQDADSGPAVAPENLVETLRSTGGKALRRMLGKRVFDLKSEADLLCSVFENEEGEAIHLVNVSGTIADGGKAVTHLDPIPQFCAGAKPIGEIKIRADCPFQPQRAVLVTPENNSETELSCSFDGTGVRLSVPAGTFAGYGVVRLLK